MTLTDRLKAWATNNLPFIFSLLRTLKPILVLKEFALVTRFDDVQEVLSRPDELGVTYAEKMSVVTNGGNFFLGMENTPTYTRDVSNMRIVVRRDDVDTKIAPMIERLSDEIISNKQGKLDAVQDFTKVVPARFVRDYMGIAGPTEAELIDWTTYMFQYLFFPNNPKDDDAKAVSYAEKCRNYLDRLIAERKQDPQPSDDIIARCLALQQSATPGMTDLDIRNNLIGIIIGAIPTTSKCAALVIDYLLDHPASLASAQDSARGGDNLIIRQYVLEALRFNSFGAGVFRIANQDYTIAKGCFRSKKIKKGTTILAATQSAMLDGRKLDSPGRFQLDRPRSAYMHFGYGMHCCFGEHINLVQIPIIVSALLKLPDLRRSEGAKGALQYRGPFPESLMLEFGAPPQPERKQSGQAQ